MRCETPHGLIAPFDFLVRSSSLSTPSDPLSSHTLVSASLFVVTWLLRLSHPISAKLTHPKGPYDSSALDHLDATARPQLNGRLPLRTSQEL